MKVAHVIPSVAARDGGPSTSVLAMCRALKTQGVEVTLVTTDADGPHSLPVDTGHLTDWQGVRTIFFKRQWTESFKYSSALSSWLREHVRSFDLVHVHGVLSHAPLAAAAACQGAGVPYVLRPLGTLDPWSLGQKRAKKALLLSLVGRRALNNAAAIHCTSGEEQRAVESYADAGRAVVIPLGVDADLFDGTPAPQSGRERCVAVVSRLHPVKNLEALIDAFVDAAEFIDRRSEDTPEADRWTLVIAGSGDAAYEARLRALARQRGFDRRIIFRGWVDRAGKANLLRRASLFALPSFHENFGVSLVEAMATGTPVLVSSGVHLAETIAHARAGWVTDTDRRALTGGLLEAWQSDRRDDYGRAARDLARRFAWPRIASSLSTLYTALIAGTPAVERVEPSGAQLAARTR